MDKLYIVVPAYNESENIKNLIDDWYPIVEKHNGNG
jgi:glycosyltransferase involved in cell wall biosynthesis